MRILLLIISVIALSICKSPAPSGGGSGGGSSVAMMTYTISGVSNAIPKSTLVPWTESSFIAAGAGIVAADGEYFCTNVSATGTARYYTNAASVGYWVYSEYNDGWNHVLKSESGDLYQMNGNAYPWEGSWNNAAIENDPPPSITQGSSTTSGQSVLNYFDYVIATNSVPVVFLSNMAGTNGVAADTGSRFFLHLTDNLDGTATATWTSTP